MLDCDKICSRINQLRKEKGWSVKELAEKLGVSEKTVYKWEGGKGIPDVGIFPTLAKVFGESIEYFMPEIEEVIKEPEKVEVDISKEVEKYKPLCVQHGILILDELIKIKNLKVIKEFLDNYPISFKEVLTDMSEKKQWKELYRFAVDYGLEGLAAAVIKNDENKIRIQIDIHFTIVFYPDEGNGVYYGKSWVRERLEEFSESVVHEKPTDYKELFALDRLNREYFIGESVEQTKRHLLEVLSGMEEYNG